MSATVTKCSHCNGRVELVGQGSGRPKIERCTSCGREPGKAPATNGAAATPFRDQPTREDRRAADRAAKQQRREPRLAQAEAKRRGFRAGRHVESMQPPTHGVVHRRDGDVLPVNANSPLEALELLTRRSRSVVSYSRDWT